MDAVADQFRDEAGDVRVVDERAQEWERHYAQWIHLGSLIGCVVAAVSIGIGLPMVLLVVLVLWLVKRTESPFVDDHGREAVNFQISLLIYSVIAFVLSFACIGFLLIPPIALLALLGTLMGSKAAARGEYYRYPACIRLLR